MLTNFFFQLRDGGLKPSITELLTLFDAMKTILDETGVDLPEGYTAQSVYTNDFIDPSIGL